MPNTPPSTREAPSLPNSPLAKRPKTMSETFPQGDATVSISGARTIPNESGVPKLHNTPATLSAAQEAGVMSKTAPLQVKLLSDKARAPTRGSAFAAGYDLYCSKTTTIPAHSKAMVPTDISIAVPPGTYGRVAPRSGLAAKHGINTGAGVIDLDYRGPVFVLLFNHEGTDFEVAEGDRCAQLVLERIVNPDVVVVQELEDTDRGAGGFGSTGGFAKTNA